MDTKTPKQRSLNMQHIRARDTKPEIILRKALWHAGIRYRKNYNGLPGKPDIVITKYHIVIFVDGEFWHGKGFNDSYGQYDGRKYHSLEEQLEHSHNSSFWLHKIKHNIEHDAEINEQLRMMGWKVLRFWSKDVVRYTAQCVKTVQETIFDSKTTE